MNEELNSALLKTHEIKELVKKDIYRPSYHFIIPFDLGYPGDPNAPFYANGFYHLFFIYNSRKDSYRWGHAISGDLLHWSFLKDALIPDEIDGGIYSGGCLLDDDNSLLVAYWALGRTEKDGGIRLAKALPPLYEDFVKLDGYAIKSSEFGIFRSKEGAELACADPSNIFKIKNSYYLLTGNKPLLDKYRNKEGIDECLKGDRCDLFESKDLKHFDFKHIFYNRKIDNSFTDISEDCMCPYFGIIPNKKGENTNKYIMLFLAHNTGSQYYVGHFDENNLKFEIESHGRMSFKDNCLFAPEAMRDKNGRLLVFNWLRDNQDDDLERELSKGWSGIHSIIREMWLNEDGSVGIEPITEMNNLRVNEKSYLISENSHEEISLSNVHCEIEFETTCAEGNNGLKLYYNENDYVDICVDSINKKVVIDNLNSNSKGRLIKDEAPFDINIGEKIKMRIFIDGSVIEVFVNSKQAVTRQVFPPNFDNLKIVVDTKGKNVNIKLFDLSPCIQF